MGINLGLGKRQLISRILIFSGVACLLTAGIYEAANYPWRAVFTPPEVLNAEILPDPPAPVPDESAEIVPYSEDAFTEADWLDDETSALPEQDTLFSSGAEKKRHSGSNSVGAKLKYMLLGTLKIPKLSVSVNLFEGSGKELALGVGHVRGTALPGAEGNCVVAGHRLRISMHPFRHADMLAEGDLIRISFSGHEYTYAAVSQFVVTPDETWVLLPDKNERYMLSLLTCDPPQNPVNRRIVRCRLIGVDGVPPEEYYKPSPPPAQQTAPPAPTDAGVPEISPADGAVPDVSPSSDAVPEVSPSGDAVPDVPPADDGGQGALPPGASDDGAVPNT